jgi:peptidase M23-like protein
MFRFLLALLVLHASPLLAQGLALPFEGRWFVMQGGDTPNVNNHMQVESQWFAIDFAKVGGLTGRALTSGAPGTSQRLEDFYGWSAEVRAPAAGETVAVENSLPDNPLGAHDTAHPLGNHVVLRIGERYYYLAHLQQGSVRVRPGDRVERGQLLGLCGNSGNSDFPHVHLHVTRSPNLGEGRGEIMTFSGVALELSGKHITEGEWPLIRGLFVENR